MNGCDTNNDLRCSELDTEINQSLGFIDNINSILDAGCKKQPFVFV